jgi:hypothetical protein
LQVFEDQRVAEARREGNAVMTIRTRKTTRNERVGDSKLDQFQSTDHNCFKSRNYRWMCVPSVLLMGLRAAMGFKRIKDLLQREWREKMWEQNLGGNSKGDVANLGSTPGHIGG